MNLEWLHTQNPAKYQASLQSIDATLSAPSLGLKQDKIQRRRVFKRRHSIGLFQQHLTEHSFAEQARAYHIYSRGNS
jgi:hypothetical protein